MAIIAGIAGVAGRFAGRLLNAVLGWATILLFGQVSGARQTVLLVIALASIVWVILVVGVIVPDVGTMLLAFVPVPSFVSEDLVRLAMLAAAIALPLLVGIAALVVMDADQRPKGVALLAAVARGYPFTLLLAATIVLLGVVALVRRLRALSKRWEDAHVAVIIKPGGYNETLDMLATVLAEGGIPVRTQAAPRVMSAPPRLLAKVAGSGLGSLVPERLMLLQGDDLEALVYPSDISIVGAKDKVALARALIATQLVHAPAYLTTDAKAQELEDEIGAIADHVGTAPEGAIRERLEAIDERLMSLTIPYDEWEILYRERLQVEREASSDGRAIGDHRPDGADDAPTNAALAAQEPPDVVGTVRSLGLVAIATLVAQRLIGRRS